MARQETRYDIQDGLYIYKQSNSKKWYARFVVEGNWYAKATKTEHQEKAVKKALELLAEYRIKIEHGIPIHRTKRSKQYSFSIIADHAIRRMESANTTGTGKAIFTDYIQALNKYHKKYFQGESILEVDRQSLLEFDTWRIEKLGRVPAKSTILNHNAALNRVFDEAVIRKYITVSQVPALCNSGVVTERRASFTEVEYKVLVEALPEFIKAGRTKKSRMIRELLSNYMAIVANSGIRPGTEMDNITWGDISIGRKNEVMVLYITVKKGKTTTYTGSRKVVCRDDAHLAFTNLREMFPDRKPTDKVFVLEDGTQTNRLGHAFRQLLERTGMEFSSEGKRVLYSLRHSYITWQLMAKVPAQVLAVQCGTSISMLERFYSHVVPEMFTQELAGVHFSDDEESLLPKRLDLVADAGEIEIVNQYIDEWETEYAERGCI